MRGQVQEAVGLDSVPTPALEDDLVLSVDASALPRVHLGPDHQSQTGLAIILANGMLNGWAGED